LSYYVRMMRREDIAQIAEIDREAFPTQLPPPNYYNELQNRLARYVVCYSEPETAEEPEVKPEEPKSEEKSEEPEVKEEPKEEVKEELSAEDELKVINNAIEILKAKIPKAVNELSEDSRFSELSARIEKLEQMVTEKLGEFTQKLSSLESPGTTEKLSESKKSSEVLEKLSVEAKNKFSLDENEVSNGTLNFASSLIEKHLK